MRFTSPRGLFARAALAAALNGAVLVVAIGFLVGVGGLALWYLLRFAPGPGTPGGWWLGSFVVSALVVVPASALVVGKTLRNERRQLLDETVPVSESDLEAAESVEASVGRFASQLDVPAPTVRIHPSSTPLAYTTYRPADPALRTGTVAAPVVVLSEGVVGVLSRRERDAVLAHELAHVANDDLRMTTWILVPLVVAQAMAADDGMTANAFDIIGYAGTIVASVGAGVFTRGREFAADGAATSLTGDPGALAAAIERLDERTPEKPTSDLRAHAQSVNAISVLPAMSDGAVAVGPGSTHPSVEARLARLESMVEREPPETPPVA